MRNGYSKESIKGRYDELVAITDGSLARDWPVGKEVPVLQNMQYIVIEQLGTILTGAAPREYVKDIRTAILYILNVLVTRQRPKFLLKDPRYTRKSASRSSAADDRRVSTRRRAERRREPQPGRRHHGGARARPELMPESDLILSLTGPFVAGLDTVANTTAAVVYSVLKHGQVGARAAGSRCALRRRDDRTGGPAEASRQSTARSWRRCACIRSRSRRCARRRAISSSWAIASGRASCCSSATSVPHFMEEYFPNPDVFDIDRYEKPRAEHLKPGVYSPYGRGPHTCLGKSLAEVQMAISMARLFYSSIWR